jgi:hypothetical protein
MARKVLTVCDLHAGDVPGGVPVGVQLGDERWRLDLCEQHAADVREVLEPLLGSASNGQGAPARSRVLAGSRRDRSAERGSVREWARAQGYPVAGHGRLSREVVAAYQSANSGARAG